MINVLVGIVIPVLYLLFYFYWIYRERRRRAPTAEETVRCPRCRQEVPAWNTVTVEEKDWVVPHMAPPRVLDYFVGQALCRACAEVSPIRWERGEAQLAFKRREAAAQEESTRAANEAFMKAVRERMRR